MVDNNVGEFFKIHILLIPELLKMVEQYFSSLLLIHWKHLVSRLETSLVVQFFDPAINLDLYGVLCKGSLSLNP